MALDQTLRISASNWHRGNYGHCGCWLVLSGGTKNATRYGTYMALNGIIRAPSDLEVRETPGRAGTLDRRKRTRAQVHWPLSFMLAGTPEVVQTVTQDLSSDGFYCVAKARFIPGETVDCMLALPTPNRHGGTGASLVFCKVRVIRVEVTAEGGRYGAGCQIIDYRFVNSA
jgi:hypothetical protein